MCNHIPADTDSLPEPRRRLDALPIGRLGHYPASMFVARVPVSKPAAVFLWEWADAQLHDDTLAEFVRAHPDDFPAIGTAVR